MLKIKKFAIALCLCLCLVVPFVFTGCGLNNESADLKAKISSLETELESVRSELPSTREKICATCSIWDSVYNLLPNLDGNNDGVNDYRGLDFIRMNNATHTETSEGFNLGLKPPFANLPSNAFMLASEETLDAVGAKFGNNYVGAYSDAEMIDKPEGSYDVIILKADGKVYSYINETKTTEEGHQENYILTRSEVIVTLNENGKIASLVEHCLYEKYVGNALKYRAQSQTNSDIEGYNFNNPILVFDYKAVAYNFDVNGEIITTGNEAPAWVSGRFKQDPSNLVRFADGAGEPEAEFEIEVCNTKIYYYGDGYTPTEEDRALYGEDIVVQKNEAYAYSKIAEFDYEFVDLAPFYAD